MVLAQSVPESILIEGFEMLAPVIKQKISTVINYQPKLCQSSVKVNDAGWLVIVSSLM